MFPELFSFKAPDFLTGIFKSGQITVYSYGVLIGLGVLVSFYITLYKSRKLGMDSDKLSTIYLWAFAAAFIGGKLFFYLENPGKYFSNPSEMLKFGGGGFVFYGSLIFTVPVIIWRLNRISIPVRPFLDILAFAGPVLHSIGRMGCFMAGCCHGRVCDSVLGVTFSHPKSLAEPLNMPLYPTQLFDIGVNIIILLTVFFVNKKKKFEGQLFVIYMVMYAVGRSIVEEFRGDEARGFVFDSALSHSQFIAILIFSASIFIWRQWSRSAKNPDLPVKSDVE